MKIKTISAVYERKFNTGDYSSMTIGATVWADLDEGDDPEKAFEQLYALAKEEVKTQAMPVLSKLSIKTQEVFQGLPVKGNGNGEAK